MHPRGATAAPRKEMGQHDGSGHGTQLARGPPILKWPEDSKAHFALFGLIDVVRTRMWTLVGARMRAFGSRNLGVSTFPWEHVTDTRERRSHHLSFYDPNVEGG
ncbi:hypothetical protein CRG98_031306 [Punica granatum]|uniref:Uncharacterized protein n=1 Tax=Punica granatum TaxID=22663 RepID=A0A2I0IWB8_PUNGR|nr:hypothetical protein CRG98_031306 [Punica granatum]